MCLNLKKDKTVKVATEDIVCYKFLRVDIVGEIIDPPQVAKFTGVINELLVEGTLFNDNKRIFLFTNEGLLDGAFTDRRHDFGYEYSWIFDSVVSSIIVDGKELVTFRTRYITPYQEAEVKIGETYKSSLTIIDCAVYEGLHSFKYLKDAIEESNPDPDICSHNYLFVECIIPKGSSYYEGFFAGDESFASDTLTYVRIIE